MNNQDDVGSDRLEKDALRHVSTINDHDLKFGIPSSLFWGGMVMTIIFLVTLPWFIAPLFAAIYFLTMHSIHEDDPQALQGWIRLLTPSHVHQWIGGEHKVRQVVFIDKEDS